MHVTHTWKNVAIKIAVKHAKIASMPAAPALKPAKNAAWPLKRKKRLAIRNSAINAKKPAINALRRVKPASKNRAHKLIFLDDLFSLPSSCFLIEGQSNRSLVKLGVIF